MTCRRIERSWPAYLAGDLSAWGRRRFERHLAACPACRGRRAAHEALRERLRNALPAPATIGDDEWRRVLAALPPERAPRWRAGLALAFAGALAAIVVALALPSPPLSGPPGVEADPGSPAVAVADAATGTPAAKGERVVVRLATSDPKVKVVWVLDPDLPL